MQSPFADTLKAKKWSQPYPGVLSGSTVGVSILFICLKEDRSREWGQ